MKKIQINDGVVIEIQNMYSDFDASKTSAEIKLVSNTEGEEVAKTIIVSNVR